MSTTGKKGKKSKGKKVSLQEFVQAPVGTGVTQVQVPTKLSWADECDEDDDIQVTKLIDLPTASRAARLLNDDCVPSAPPFMAYLSNLPYDVEEMDIENFFHGYAIVTVRLPRSDDESGGKSRGYGYVEFESREDLINALSMPDPTIRGRRIKIDLTSEEGNRNRRNNRYGNDNYGSSDRNNTNWRDRQDGGFSGGRDNVDGGRRRNDYGNRRNNDREPVVVDASEEGSWRMGDRPAYSPPRERKQYDRPPRDDRDFNRGGDYRDGGRDGRDRFGGRRRNDYERPPMQNEEQAERPKLNLQPRTLPMPELSFPTEEEIPTVFKSNAGKQNGDVDHDESEDGENKPKENGDDQLEEEREEKPKPRGVPSAAVFGDAKPVDTAAKEREVEEKLAQRKAELKQKAEEERKRLAELKEKENNGTKEETPASENDQQHYDDNGDQEPKSIEPVKSWRTKDGDYRPRNKNYSPERDNRGGHQRRQDGGKLRDRNYNRDNNRNNDRYGNNRNNRNYNNQKDGGGRGGYRSDRPPRHERRDDHHQQQRGERREYNRDQRDVAENMPKYKPVEGPNFSVSNTFAGLVVDDQED